MAQKVIYSDQTGPSLPDGTKLYFRTVTSYTENQTGQVSNRETSVFYTAIPGGRASNGDVWTPGSPTGESFNPGGFVRAATSRDGGKTFQLLNYTQDDADNGRIPSGKNVGDPILGATAIQSLTSRGQVLNEAIQNSIINTAKDIRPGLAPQLAAKLQNAASTSPQGDFQGGNQESSQGSGASSSSDGTPSSETPPPADLPNPVNLNPQEIKLLSEQIPIVPLDGFVQYPKLMKPEQDKIKFTAVRIKPKTLINGPGLGFRFPGPEYERVGGRVFLAIQAPISDQNGVDWGPNSVNAIESAAFIESYRAITSDLGQVEANIKNTLNEIYKTASAQSERIKRAMAGQAASVNNVLSRTDSAILNPNLELLFQAPQLRPFTFQFKLTARSMDEARDIKTIIKYFKYHMAVRQEKNELFLRAPHVFTIQYMKGMKPNHPGINMISPTEETKACALTNFSVDYTPLGTYMTYIDNEDNPNDPANGTMVAYTLSMQFQEITPIYDTDYSPEGAAANHPIGF